MVEHLLLPNDASPQSHIPYSLEMSLQSKHCVFTVFTCVLTSWLGIVSNMSEALTKIKNKIHNPSLKISLKHFTFLDQSVSQKLLKIINVAHSCTQL